MLLDIVFSLDSVLTAVGMANDIPVMIAAVVIAVGVMLFASGPISRFVHEHPTVKMLALSVPAPDRRDAASRTGSGSTSTKGYIYAAMGFAVFVEMLNLAARKRRRGARPWTCIRPSSRTSRPPRVLRASRSPATSSSGITSPACVSA